MPAEVKTGGLKSFVYDKNKPVYSSEEEEERYSRLGEEANRIIKENKRKKKLMKWFWIILGLIVLAVLVYVLLR